ncbi:MAG: hypothetical protein H7122_06345 [Chitinophagaceae bacterium]|nr:hypothetical protein [Chitinophagaceae bacterium]
MKKLVLPADSKEVQMEYHLGKIKLLESELNRLTILEHPRQIQSLCCKIMHIKRLLAKIRPDKK